MRAVKLPALPALRPRRDPRRARGYRGYRGGRRPVRWFWWLALGALLLFLALLEWNLCRAFPQVSVLCRGAAAVLSRGLALATGLVPFPLSEWLLVVLTAGWLLWLAVRLCHRRWAVLGRGLCRLACMLCAAVFLFVALYGVHHTAPSLASSLGLEVAQYTVEELDRLAARTVEQVNALAAQAPRDGSDSCAFGSFRELAEQVSAAYGDLAEKYTVFDRPGAGRVKRSLLGGRAMSWVDLAGYYCPWTAESVISSDVVQSHIPFNIAHETAHGLGIGPEAECNFAAWLACKGSSDIRLRYSAWLCAYVYANNALYAVDREASAGHYSALCPQARHDLQVLNDSLKRFEGRVNDLGSAANDALIRATGQSDGVRSYGRVVDLMLAYYSVEME